MTELRDRTAPALVGLFLLRCLGPLSLCGDLDVIFVNSSVVRLPALLPLRLGPSDSRPRRFIGASFCYSEYKLGVIRLFGDSIHCSFFYAQSLLAWVFLRVLLLLRVCT